MRHKIFIRPFLKQTKQKFPNFFETRNVCAGAGRMKAHDLKCLRLIYLIFIIQNLWIS